MLPPLLGGRQCCPGMFDFRTDPSQLTRKGGWGHTGVHASTESYACMHLTRMWLVWTRTQVHVNIFPNVHVMTRDVFVFHHRKKCHSLELIMIINTNKYRF